MDVRSLPPRILIEMAQRRQRPGTGSQRTFLKRRTARMTFPDLTPILESIPWATVGAVATRLYMPERTTQDLDLAIRATDASRVRQRLTAAGFTYQGELSIGGSSWLTPEGFMVDVLECPEPWFDQAVAEAAHNRDLQGLPVLPLPYLVLLKFQAGRVQDLADITRMLGQAEEAALSSVRAVFERWLPEAREDLESLIALGRLEMQEDAR